MSEKTKLSKEERYRRAMNNIKYHSEENSKWKFFFALFALVCVSAFTLKKYFCDKADVLGGRSTIKYYLVCNFTALAAVSAVLLMFVIMLIKMHGISRRDSMEKVMFVVGTAMIVGYSFVALLLIDKNIYYDYKNIAVYKGGEYVLCAQGEEYCVAFQDSNGSYLLRIPKSVYDSLKDGERTESDDDMTSMVKDAGYGSVEHYDSDVEIEYYRYSAIFESADL